MAFLDNSGDIILDAVLTDEGVKAMADGNFKITKFALGDDEINYTLYDKNNSGGPAYYDLEILQTPVMEAFASQIGAINYGLITLPAEVLYVPTLRVNTKTLGLENKVPKNGVFYVTDPTNDTTTTTISAILQKANISYIDGQALANAGYVLIEEGIESADVLDTTANVSSYLTQQGMVDSSLEVSFDTRIFNSVMGTGAGSTVANDGTANSLNAKITLANSVRTSHSPMKNYGTGRVQTMVNQIYDKTGGNNTKSQFSAISGPASRFAALSPNIKAGLATAEYSKYGTRNANPDGIAGATPISYIDSVVYVHGASTGASIQLNMRIARVYKA